MGFGNPRTATPEDLSQQQANCHENDDGRVATLQQCREWEKWIRKTGLNNWNRVSGWGDDTDIWEFPKIRGTISWGI